MRAEINAYGTKVIITDIEAQPDHVNIIINNSNRAVYACVPIRELRQAVNIFKTPNNDNSTGDNQV